jgi:mRNA interferase HicA
MKRKALVRHLLDEGCKLHREGARHSLYINVIKGRFATVPRHAEIDAKMTRKICQQLGITVPTSLS